MIVTKKDPNSIEDFALDWSARAASDTISASTWTVSTGLTVVADSYTDTTTTVRLSGGVVGDTNTNNILDACDIAGCGGGPACDECNLDGIPEAEALRILGVDFAAPAGRYLLVLAIVTLMAVVAKNPGRIFLTLRTGIRQL